MAKVTYTLEGNVSGACGHEHRTIETAYACLLRQYRRCPAGCHYDYEIVRADGSDLDEHERNALWHIQQSDM